jgi:hypothetical protein
MPSEDTPPLLQRVWHLHSVEHVRYVVSHDQRKGIALHAIHKAASDHVPRVTIAVIIAVESAVEKL